MKHITRLLLITIVTTISSIVMASQEIIIRTGKIQDLEAINHLSRRQHLNGGFKEGLRKGLDAEMMVGSMTDGFINKELEKFIAMQKSKNTDGIKKTNGHHVLVAYLKEPNTAEKFAGYCLYNKENAKQIYISYLVVDQTLRNTGIGRMLVETAFEMFNDITSCKFRWLAHDTTMNNLFEKYCIETNCVHLDYMSGRIIEDIPQEELKGKITFPIAFKEYIFSLKKNQ